VNSWVLDASAVLTLVLQERGADRVLRSLEGAVLSAVNYSEVIARMLAKGSPLEDCHRHLARLTLNILPFDAEHASLCAALRPKTLAFGLSLADRSCLALALSLGLPVLTADKEWSRVNVGVKVEVIR